MTMKLTWTKEELTRRSGQYWWTCGFCQVGSDHQHQINHSRSCPFSDETVQVVTISVGPEHDADICGACDFTADQCSAFSVLGGWDQVTHERLKTICPEYAKEHADRAAYKKEVEDWQKAGLICGQCDVTSVAQCPACIHAENDRAITDHKKLLTICKRYKDKCGI